MGTNFEDIALADLMYWVQNDRKIAGKIYNLIQDGNIHIISCKGHYEE